MPLQALVVSSDRETLRTMGAAAAKFGVEAEYLQAALDAEVRLSEQHFDAVMVDCDDLQGATSLIGNIRSGEWNRSAIVFALLHGKTPVRTAYEMGANFVLEKPITSERAERSMRAAHNLIQRERRRYRRIDVQWPGVLKGTDFPETPITIQNISEGGVAISADRSLGGLLRANLLFDVPAMKTTVIARVEATWSDDAGRAGLKFLQLDQDSRRAVDFWLAQSPADV